MKSFVEYLTELKLTDKLEIIKTPLLDAKKQGLMYLPELYDMFPKFDENYLRVRTILQQHGKTKRQQMPVIMRKDYDKFREYLSSHGVKSELVEISASKLKPMQRQVYLTKTLMNIKKHGFSAFKTWLRAKTHHLLVSSDNFLIDGHHRWSSTMIWKPKLKVSCIKANIPKKELLALALHFSDKIVKNTRNESFTETLLENY
jgi:hypothetical protein